MPAGVGTVGGWAVTSHRLREIATDIDGAVDRCDERVATLVRATETTVDTWRGPAADAGRAAAHTRRTQANRVAMAAQCVADAIARRGPDLAHAASTASALAASLVHDGYEVADDGGVTHRPGHRPADVPRDASAALALHIADTNAALHTESLRRLLEGALSADADLAASIDAATVALRSVVVGGGSDPATSAAPTGSAVHVAAVWGSTSDAQRIAWATADPGLGNRAGVPAADRDRINRMRLSAIRSPTAGQLALRRALATPGRFLMTLRDDGRAVVAAGDPDGAAHVAVMVPGTGTSLGSVRTNLARADAMRAAGATAGGEGGVSVVVWQDYGAPADLVAASGLPAARTAAPDLREFVSGLRATHGEDQGPHLTVLGHSYGSTVVTTAASGSDALAADDVVLVASPGTGGAARVGDLRLRGLDSSEVADHVWTVTAARDPIRLAAPYVLGPDPDGVRFGARHLPSSPGATPWDAHSRYGVENHSGYWDPGTPSLLAMGQVIAGRRDR
ncbi:alpha/beta hydrolase [Williamsia deligens]|uniref:Alpha/beta hydrolase n=1 Tax=Williamsia deligens TaxID=321325 RepID=A0ABW3G8H4_9NOCA|nr:alpha/beta hydrolase [Williamsia deligens]MCP2192759.1 Alpha/beta hydrolase [Williamsia deligens]